MRKCQLLLSNNKKIIKRQPTNCLSGFDNFVGLSLKRDKKYFDLSIEAKYKSKAYSEPYQTSKMDFFCKKVDGYQLLTILAKIFILTV